METISMQAFLLRLPSPSLEGRVKGLYEENFHGTDLLENNIIFGNNFLPFSQRALILVETISM